MTAGNLIIWCSSPDPVADERDLGIGQRRLALRHAVACDAGTGDLAIEVRVGRIVRHDAQQGGVLRAGAVHDVRVGLTGAEHQLLLPSPTILTADGRAGRGEDLSLPAGE